MASFVAVGKYKINIDNITYVVDWDDKICVHFAGGGEPLHIIGQVAGPLTQVIGRFTERPPQEKPREPPETVTGLMRKFPWKTE